MGLRRDCSFKLKSAAEHRSDFQIFDNRIGEKKMKRTLMGIVALVFAGGVYEVVFPLASKADTQQLQKTETKIGEVVAQSKKVAESMSAATAESDPTKVRDMLTRDLLDLAKQKNR